MKFQKELTVAAVTSMLIFGFSARAAEPESGTGEAAAVTASAEKCGQQEKCGHKDAEAMKAAAEAELEAQKAAFAKMVGDSQVSFEKASSNVTPASRDALEKMARYLQENQDAVLTITGHASPDGSKEYNQLLSEKRAESVAGELKKLGVSAGQLRVIGAGATAGGDESNRNVTFGLD